jgi:hypothetical protein
LYHREQGARDKLSCLIKERKKKKISGYVLKNEGASFNKEGVN